jgi:hypothetical protein
MKAIEAEQLDRKRALTDVVYFAEKYLDIKLDEHQIKIVRALMAGETINYNGGRPRMNTCVKVATAQMRLGGMKVVVDRRPIDV